MLHHEFAQHLNVVILHKTNLTPALAGGAREKSLFGLEGKTWDD